ncbi:MAG: hypothetical protein JW818_22035 [Pirellulales bacterium]|nr:hypothetical protein [Pirellulales bacterium]
MASGCSRTPPRVYLPEVNASAAGEKAMELYDTNKDGRVDGAELDAVPVFKRSMKWMDTDGDNAVNAEEVTKRIVRWQELKTGRTGVSCRVTFRGRPLANAKVVFEPEPFLGENFKAAEGMTDQSGNVSLSIPNEKNPGMTPGFYKIRVTSDQVKIPPKFNTQTTLGIEIAKDVPEMDMSTIPLDLK